MSFYVIVSPKVDKNDFSDQTDALEEVKVDYTDLLQLTLQHWHLFSELKEDRESLNCAVEHYLATNAARHLDDYAHMQVMVDILVKSITMFYETLSEQLTPLLDCYGVDIQIRLTRYLHKDALIRVETPS